MTSFRESECTRYGESCLATFSKFCWSSTFSISKTWRREKRGRHTSCKSDCNNSTGIFSRSKKVSWRNSRHLSREALPPPPYRTSPEGCLSTRICKKLRRSLTRGRSGNYKSLKLTVSDKTLTKALSMMRPQMKKPAKRTSNASRTQRVLSNTKIGSKATIFTNLWAQKRPKIHSTIGLWMAWSQDAPKTANFKKESLWKMTNFFGPTKWWIFSRFLNCTNKKRKVLWESKNSLLGAKKTSWSKSSKKWFTSLKAWLVICWSCLIKY